MLGVERNTATRKADEFERMLVADLARWHSALFHSFFSKWQCPIPTQKHRQLLLDSDVVGAAKYARQRNNVGMLRAIATPSRPKARLFPVGPTGQPLWMMASPIVHKAHAMGAVVQIVIGMSRTKHPQFFRQSLSKRSVVDEGKTC